MDRENMSVVDGAYAVAHAVKVCKPDVIAAYPITPQTNIVEHISQFIADGEMDDVSINVESEHSAMSLLVGAGSVGARAYSATASQGLVLMSEVLFNVSGMRLPIVMTVVNRAMSAPLSIWNDHQDSISQRDTGWIQLYAEDVQEAADMTAQAFRIAESRNVLLPVMVCMDGFILSHVYEPVVLLEEELIDEFLPGYSPVAVLDPDDPKTFGAFADPNTYTEFRYLQEVAMRNAIAEIEDIANEFQEIFGRYQGGLIEEYMAGDAEILILAMGSIVGTIKEVIPEMRTKGVSVGLIKIRSFRPFPAEAIKKAVADAGMIVVLDKNISIGLGEGALLTETKSIICNSSIRTPVIGFMLGHGGRDIPKAKIEQIIIEASEVMKQGITVESRYADLKEELL